MPDQAWSLSDEKEPATDRPQARSPTLTSVVDRLQM
jgi:hypothetical protein